MAKSVSILFKWKFKNIKDDKNVERFSFFDNCHIELKINPLKKTSSKLATQIWLTIKFIRKLDFMLIESINEFFKRNIINGLCAINTGRIIIPIHFNFLKYFKL